MAKLTAEKCREQIASINGWFEDDGFISTAAELHLEAYKIALSVLEQPDEWISCAERLPECIHGVAGKHPYMQSDYVLVCDMTEVFEEDREPSIDCLSTIDGWERWHTFFNATHWRPLPALPKMKTDTGADITDNNSQADDGWIEWGGGSCPVPDATLVKIKMRNGEQKGPGQARYLYWEKGNAVRDEMDCDIIAYRVIENDGGKG